MKEPSKNANTVEETSGGLWTFVRRESLSWVGIAGAVVTLLTGLQDFIKLASWAALLVDNSAQITLWLWSTIFFFLPKVTPLAAWYLNLVTFFVTVAATSIRKGSPSLGLQSRSALRDTLVGLGLAVTLGLSISSLVGLMKSGALAASDTDFIRTVLDWIGAYLPQKLAFIAALLLVVLPLVLLMNALARAAKFFGGVADQHLAVTRIWRINFGVLLIIMLSAVSKYIAPLCEPDGVLAWLCG